MKMLPRKSKNCLESTGRDLIWVFFFLMEVKLGYE